MGWTISESSELCRQGGRDCRRDRVRARSPARIAAAIALAAFLAGCGGGDKPEVAAGQTLSEEALRQKCADPQWRDSNLGIWYAVCRQSVAW